MYILYLQANTLSWELPIALGALLLLALIYGLTGYYQRRRAKRQEKPPRTKIVNDSSYQLEDRVSPERSPIVKPEG